MTKTLPIAEIASFESLSIGQRFRFVRACRTDWNVTKTMTLTLSDVCVKTTSVAWAFPKALSGRRVKPNAAVLAE